MVARSDDHEREREQASGQRYAADPHAMARSRVRCLATSTCIDCGSLSLDALDVLCSYSPLLILIIVVVVIILVAIPFLGCDCLCTCKIVVC